MASLIDFSSTNWSYYTVSTSFFAGQEAFGSPMRDEGLTNMMTYTDPCCFLPGDGA